jgi:hypothetical protein
MKFKSHEISNESLPLEQNPELDQQSDDASWVIHIPAATGEYYWIGRQEVDQGRDCARYCI